MATATLIKSPGFWRSDDPAQADRLINMAPYVGQTAKVVESHDSGYDTDRPTGYEPVDYLLEFPDGLRVWMPGSLFCGEEEDSRGRFHEIWERYLKFNNEDSNAPETP